MHCYLPTYSKLLVISDTGMFEKEEKFYAFGPVVRELEALDCFEKITWIGFQRSDEINNKAFLKIIDPRIQIQTLKPSGGKDLSDKFLILLNYPRYFIKILREINKAQYIHVRAPSNPAVIAMFLSYLYPQKKFWFKYAGAWKGETSAFYNLQRMWLKKLSNNCKVTVNGKWPDQSKNIVSFENPCLNKIDRLNGREIVEKKALGRHINYCFVGGLNENKGSLLLLEALGQLKTSSSIGTVHIVGDGDLMSQLQQMALHLEFNIIFHGNLSKEEVAEIYEICHYILLPSKSEGFPKVIGEAMNYGCIPIVSNISSIGQYVLHRENGILLDKIEIQTIKNAIMESLKISHTEFNMIIQNNYELAAKFTYSHYKKRIINEVLN